MTERTLKITIQGQDFASRELHAVAHSLREVEKAAAANPAASAKLRGSATDAQKILGGLKDVAGAARRPASRSTT